MLAVFGLLAAGCLVLLVPWQPLSIRITDLAQIDWDLAFISVAGELLLSAQQFGSEVIFTYGPLMFLATNTMEPELIPWLLASRSFLAIGIPIIFIVLIQRSSASFKAKTALALALAAMVYLWFIGWDQAFWISLITGFVLLRTEPEIGAAATTTLSVVAAIGLAILSLIKFNFTILSLWAVFLVGIYDLARRHIPTPTITYLVAVPAIWMACNQDLANLPEWLRLSLNLSFGYSGAMARLFWGDYPLITILLLYAAVILPVAAIAVFAWPLQFRDVVRVFFFGGLGFVSLKHAFAGNQIEQAAVVQLLVVFCVALMGVFAKTRRSGWLSLGGGLAAAIVVLALTNFSGAGLINGISRARASLGNFGQLDLSDRELTRFHQSIAAIAPFPDLRGTLDVYPVRTAIALGQRNARYQPRPAFLSLNSHTVELAQLNRDFLRTKRAPENILFEVVNPDYNNRLPSTADGPSWPEIWARYSPLYTRHGFLALKRRPEPRGCSLVPITTVDMAFGQPVAVPDAPLVFATVMIEKTWLGRLADIFYRLPHISIEIDTEDGPRRHQLVPELGRAGFLISPYVGSTEDFAVIAAAVDAGVRPLIPRVSQVTFSVEPGTEGLLRIGPVEFFRVDLTAPDALALDAKP